MIQRDPNNSWLLMNLGLAYAGLGEKDKAIRYGEQAKEKLPLSKNSWRGTYPIEYLAKIYVMVGEYDKAIIEINNLLDKPGRLSSAILQHDPAWKNLHSHPSFSKLIVPH